MSSLFFVFFSSSSAHPLYTMHPSFFAQSWPVFSFNFQFSSLHLLLIFFSSSSHHRLLFFAKHLQLVSIFLQTIQLLTIYFFLNLFYLFKFSHRCLLFFLFFRLLIYTLASAFVSSGHLATWSSTRASLVFATIFIYFLVFFCI